MARKHAQEQNDNHSRFPIESLPLELLHEVFVYLKPSEAAGLRLLSKGLANVGIQYLVPEVHLIVKQDSLDRLQEISEHPVVSQHVTSFWYEADRLYDKCFHIWEQGVRSEEWIKNALEASSIAPPGPRASRRELRAYRRAKYSSRTPRHRYTQSQLETHFATFQALISQQARILGSTFHMDRIKQALSRCSRIKEVFMSTEGFNRPRGPGQLRHNPFAEGHSWVFGDEGHDLPCGLPQTCALLLGAFDAGLQLEKISCGSVNWQLLQLSSEEISKIKSVFRSVRQLDLYFSTGVSDDDDDSWLAGPSFEIPECKRYLKQTGRLKELVTAAPDLTSLSVGFDRGQPYSATELECIGTFRELLTF